MTTDLDPELVTRRSPCMQLHEFATSANARYRWQQRSSSCSFWPTSSAAGAPQCSICRLGVARSAWSTCWTETEQSESVSSMQARHSHRCVPTGYDLIAFKSMLHDWPQDQAARFIAKPARHWNPGGTLLISSAGPCGSGMPSRRFSLLADPALLSFLIGALRCTWSTRSARLRGHSPQRDRARHDVLSRHGSKAVA